MSNLFGRLLSRGRKEVEGREIPIGDTDQFGREIITEFDRLHKVGTYIGSFEDPDLELDKENNFSRVTYAVAISLADRTVPNNPEESLKDFFDTNTLILSLTEDNFSSLQLLAQNFGTESNIFLISQKYYVTPDKDDPEVEGKIEALVRLSKNFLNTE